MTEVIEFIRIAERDANVRKALSGCFASDCRFPERGFLLWDGCVRQRRRYSWPTGFKEKWATYAHRGQRQLVKASGNGPPRTAFIEAGGNYVARCELAHLYTGAVLRKHGLSEGRHFTQSANLVCMPRPLHLHIDGASGTRLLWFLRGLSYLNLNYDPLGTFSRAQPNSHGFVGGLTCEVFWPQPIVAGKAAKLAFRDL